MAEILYRAENLLAFSSAGFFGSIWWEMPTLQTVQAVYEARLAHEKKQPGEFVMLTLLRIPKLRTMSAEVRDRTRETRQGLNVYCRADASVLETSAGPVGESIARFAIAAINLMTRATIPNKLFVTLPEAFQWLTAFTNLRTSQMSKVVEDVLRDKKA